MPAALLLDAARTPFGKYRGGLSTVRVDDLASLPLAELLRRHGNHGSGKLNPSNIDDVIYGNTNGAGEENRNVARMATLLAGLGTEVPGVTVNRLCVAGGEAIVQGARALRSGDAELLIAGGVEGMSRAPFVISKPERAFPDRMELISTELGWRLVNPEMPSEWTIPLGKATEDIATALEITREDMDAFTVRSHRRSAAAWDAGIHDGFTFDVHAQDAVAVRKDESVRSDTTTRKLAHLGSVFSPEGPLTAGNSSPRGDGAVAVILGTEGHARALDIQPLGEIVGCSIAADDPSRSTTALIPAIEQLCRRLGTQPADMDLWEINEQFAAIVLAALRHLPDVDAEKVNVHGGALAYGHPLAASMPRTVVDLCRHLRARGGGLGIAASCAAVGHAMAIAVRA